MESVESRTHLEAVTILDSLRFATLSTGSTATAKTQHDRYMYKNLSNTCLTHSLHNPF